MSRMRTLLVATVVLLVASALATACNSSSSSTSSNSTSAASGISTPAPLKADGNWVICTDVPYPPAEFQEGTDFKGYEVEMGQEIARRLGVTASFQKTGFDGIIGALLAKKCDGIISSMNITPEREKQVAFVPYMNIGQAVAVAPDAAGTINSLSDLSGKTVAVQVGTTLRAAIETANKDLSTPIKVQSFPDAGAAASALQTGKVDAFFADAPVVADYVNKQPKAFAIGGTQIQELPAGIALRKDDTELIDAVQQAVDAMYADGTMMRIFTTWKVDAFLLPAAGSSTDGTSTTMDTTTTSTMGNM